MERPSLPDESMMRRLWRATPSNQEGYHRAYSTESPEGDLLEVDFNFGRRMARISLKVAQENGREYVAVIKSGTIIQEREVAGKRSLDLTSRIGKFDRYFAHFPEASVLETIGGAYGLPTQPEAPEAGQKGSPEERGIYRIYPFERQFRPIRALKRHLRKKREREQNRGPIASFINRLPGDCFDLAIGALLYYAFLQNWLNLTELAGYLGVLAVTSGAVDWLWRQRDPMLLKVTGLLGASAYAVYIQVQYRMWAIWL